MLAGFFAESEIDPKIPMEIPGTEKSQNNLGKEQSWRLRLPDFKTYSKPTSNGVSVGLAEDRQKSME